MNKYLTIGQTASLNYEKINNIIDILNVINNKINIINNKINIINTKIDNLLDIKT